MLFESKERRIRDARELRVAFMKFGDDTVNILAARAKDDSLPQRARRHWRRLHRKAKRQAASEDSANSFS